MEETQDHEEIIERVAALDIGKAEVVALCAGAQSGVRPPACLGGHGWAVLVHRSAPVLPVGVGRSVVETALRFR